LFAAAAKQPGAGVTVKAASVYLATQGAISVAETGIEAAATRTLGGDFSYGESFLKNFAINTATGGIGSKGKWAYKAGAYLGRQGIEIAGETAYDVYRGRDLGTSLTVNAIGSVAGDAAGRSLIAGGRRALNSQSGQVFQAYVGGFVDGVVSVRPRALQSRLDLGLGDQLAAGLRGGRNAAAPNRVAGAADEFAEGSFSITGQGFRGYPEGVPRPQGPFRLLEGAEYDAARKAANKANQAIRKADPASLAGKEIHEIQPVKFGGSPTDPANKIPLPRDLHRREVTPWWNRLMRSLQNNGGGG